MQQEASLQILDDPLAQDLLNSRVPARLTYTGCDGLARVVRVGFLWNGEQFVIGTAPSAPNVAALATNPHVALTIDTNSEAPHILLVRGTARIAVVAGVAPECLAASKRYVSPQHWQTFETQAYANYHHMARITIAPDWAKLLDLQTWLPSVFCQLL